MVFVFTCHDLPVGDELVLEVAGSLLSETSPKSASWRVKMHKPKRNKCDFSWLQKSLIADCMTILRTA